MTRKEAIAAAQAVSEAMDIVRAHGDPHSFMFRRLVYLRRSYQRELRALKLHEKSAKGKRR